MQSMETPASTGTLKETFPDAGLEILKVPKLRTKPTTATVHEKTCQPRDPVKDILTCAPRVPKEALYLTPVPPSHSPQAILQGPRETHLVRPPSQRSVPQEILKETYTQLHPLQLWSRASPTHPVTHPMIRQQPSQGRGRSCIHCTTRNRFTV